MIWHLYKCVQIQAIESPYALSFIHFCLNVESTGIYNSFAAVFFSFKCVA